MLHKCSVFRRQAGSHHQASAGRQAGAWAFEKHLGHGDEYLADLSRSLLITRKSKLQLV
jgi:hypothetical protein